MILELNNIKEVVIEKKLEYKYFMLFLYNPKAEHLNGKYYLVAQGPAIEEIEGVMRNWELGDGDVFRIFSIMLPA